MSHFFDRLDESTPDTDPADRDWVYVPYDQLTDAVGPLSRRPPAQTGILMVETTWKGDRRPYHARKLGLILANQRHFALEQAERGFAVRYLVDDRRYGRVLAEEAAELGTLTVMRPAERELRADLAPLVDSGDLRVVDHEGWLTSRRQFRESQQEGPPWRMDRFYRRLRRDTGLLMEDGTPEGGQYSHDGDNREFWPGDPPAPTPPTFEPDPITREVAEIVRDEFGHHPGRLVAERLPATSEHAERTWKWALEECMEHFGPYEDAMSRHSRTLFHTRISPLLHLHRLLPERVVRDVASAEAPINSREGFIRQVIGWREFMRHVHREIDGFRELPGDYSRRAYEGKAGRSERPGDGGWSDWSGRTWPSPKDRPPAELDGGARPNALDYDLDLPPAYWGESSGLACLDEVVDGVWDEGWSHHITRLMVLANIATLLDVDARQLTDWFWVAYADAYDWVVEPNVLGMGTFALGDLFTTKPYVSGANYIDGMSDYCESCRFDPDENCPLTSMYWAYLDRHEEELDGNRRLGLMLHQMRERGDEQRRRDRRIWRTARETLAEGDELEPPLLED